MASDSSFKNECKKWRLFRRFSQLDLALEANISQRHLSYLETGRSQPSREMVIQLSDALDVPLRERNHLLQSAGYTAIYRESELDSPDMHPVMMALKQVLEHHNPLPAFVVDRFWNLRLQNQASVQLLNLIGSLCDMSKLVADDHALNIALLTLHPQGLRQFITNWQHVAPLLVNRLSKEANASGDSEVKQKLNDIIRSAGLSEVQNLLPEKLLPVIPIELDFSGVKLSMFSIISTLGTPQDITTDELRIEAFYPTDDKTQAFFNSQKNLLKQP
jgi:transcriptional regulator with XRE-family HTH domain